MLGGAAQPKPQAGRPSVPRPELLPAKMRDHVGQPKPVPPPGSPWRGAPRPDLLPGVGTGLRSLLKPLRKSSRGFGSALLMEDSTSRGTGAVRLEIHTHSELHYAFNRTDLDKRRIPNPIAKYVEESLRHPEDDELILFRGYTETSVPFVVDQEDWVEIRPYSTAPIGRSLVQAAINHIKNFDPAKNSVYVSSSVLPGTCSYISAKNMRSGKVFPVHVMKMNVMDPRNKDHMSAAEILMNDTKSLDFHPGIPSYIWAESQGEVLLPRGARVRSLGHLECVGAKDNERGSVTIAWNWHRSGSATTKDVARVQREVAHWNDVTDQIIREFSVPNQILVEYLDDYGGRGTVPSW